MPRLMGIHNNRLRADRISPQSIQDSHKMQWRHLVRILIWPSIFCDADLERFTLCLYNCFLKNPNSPNSFFSRLIFASVSSFSLTDGLSAHSSWYLCAWIRTVSTSQMIFLINTFDNSSAFQIKTGYFSFQFWFILFICICYEWPPLFPFHRYIIYFRFGITTLWYPLAWPVGQLKIVSWTVIRGLPHNLLCGRPFDVLTGNTKMYVIITNLSVGVCYTIPSKAHILKNGWRSESRKLIQRKETTIIMRSYGTCPKWKTGLLRLSGAGGRRKNLSPWHHYNS